VLAHVAFWRGDVDEGLHQGQIEIDRARRQGDPYRLAYVLGDNAAHCATAIDLDDLTPMVERCEDAVVLARSCGAPSVLGNALHTLGATLRYVDPVAARSALGEGLALGRDVDARFVVSVCSMHLAAIAATESSTEAISVIDESLRHLRGRDPSLFRFAVSAALGTWCEVIGDRYAAELAWVRGAVDALPGGRDVAIEERNAHLRTELVARLGDAGKARIDAGRSATHHELVTVAMHLQNSASAAIAPSDRDTSDGTGGAR
jgi:hypothetical protein